MGSHGSDDGEQHMANDGKGGATAVRGGEGVLHGDGSDDEAVDDGANDKGVGTEVPQIGSDSDEGYNDTLGGEGRRKRCTW